LELCEEGLARLASITNQVAVVSAIGPYRSGKSFLLNQLLGRTAGFALGEYVVCHVLFVRHHPVEK
jgi:nicotinamide riboside kinase